MTINLESFKKMPQEKIFALADGIESLVFEVKAQDFDPFIDYGWAASVPMSFKEHVVLNAWIIEPPLSVNPENLQPILPMWFMEGKKGMDKSEANKANTTHKLKELLREYFPSN